MGHRVRGGEADPHQGRPGRARAGGLRAVAARGVPLHGRHHRVTRVLDAAGSGRDVALVGDVDLVAARVGDQVQQPVGDVVPAGVGAGRLRIVLQRVRRAAELLHDPAGQEGPEAGRSRAHPRRRVGAGERVDPGPRLGGRVPGHRARRDGVAGVVGVGADVDVGRDQVGAGAEGVVQLPAVLPQRRAALTDRLHVVLGPADGAQREVPALARPGRGALRVVLLVDTRAVVDE